MQLKYCDLEKFWRVHLKYREEVVVGAAKILSAELKNSVVSQAISEIVIVLLVSESFIVKFVVFESSLGF